jgi:putative endonuclease
LSEWFLYVVRCADDTLYTGIATDVERRLTEHNEGPKGAKYTRARRPVELLATWPYDDRSAASSAEHAFKRLSRPTKLERIALAATPGDDAPNVLDEGFGGN